MIFPLNGPLGVGKSTLAEALTESIDRCVLLDGGSSHRSLVPGSWWRALGGGHPRTPHLGAPAPGIAALEEQR